MKEAVRWMVPWGRFMTLAACASREVASSREFPFQEGMFGYLICERAGDASSVYVTCHDWDKKHRYFRGFMYIHVRTSG